MKLILDILQGIGLAAATGVRPFLPTLAAGAFALASAPMNDIRAAKSSPGNVLVSGSPPASEMTSGRAVTAIRSRIAEDFMTCVRRANSPA